MNYNNSYGYGYQQYPTNSMNQGQSYGSGYSQAQQSNFENTFAWVYGDAGAEAFPVAPGRTVLLMHYNEPILYVKSTDMNGRPLPMEVYELVRRNGGYSQAPQLTSQQMNMNEYVKKSELEGQVNEIMNRNMASQKPMNAGNMQGQNSYQQMPQGNMQNWNQGQEVYDGKSGV